jgi:hypothetical protein
MGHYKLDEIAAIQDDMGSITCLECATSEEMANLTEDQIISDKRVEDNEDFYFCDSCKKRITAR